jgi:hypothetical protein
MLSRVFESEDLIEREVGRGLEDATNALAKVQVRALVMHLPGLRSGAPSLSYRNLGDLSVGAPRQHQLVLLRRLRRAGRRVRGQHRTQLEEAPAGGVVALVAGHAGDAEDQGQQRGAH